jgi:hypothetical protein
MKRSVSKGCNSRTVHTYVFQAVEVLVPLAACFAVERLLLFHTEGTWIRSTSLWVNDRKGSVAVLVQLLGLVTVSLVVSVQLAKRLASSISSQTRGNR